ncbi:hypothetical protein [Enterococcus thailandicus]|jgi:hypothetical protein|uniref:hypothetical protein n=2 Tax=Enterococcus thailandicus TaxID=417368 RepID=UPI00244D92EF|nr:hypothetical protein [Enterococcus thailandicus]GMC01757.1 hypothetical protein K2F_20170 [Enterococcus thailandicus]
MTEKKTSDAQIKASRKWQEKNKEQMNYIRKRSAARGFLKITNKEDINEMEQLLKNRKEELVMEEYESLKTFIENDYAERDFGHGDLEEFDPEKIMNGETVEVLSDDFGHKHSRVKVIISSDDLKLNDTLDVYTVNFMDKEVYVYYVNAD